MSIQWVKKLWRRRVTHLLVYLCMGVAVIGGAPYCRLVECQTYDTTKRDLSIDTWMIIDNRIAEETWKRERCVRFVVTADPQYFEDSGAAKNKSISDRVMKCMCDKMNVVYGTNNDSYKNYRGIIIAGDITQNNYESEWQWYKEGIGSKCRQYIFDGIGNHDLGVEKGAFIYFFDCMFLDDIDCDFENVGKRTVRDSGGGHYNWQWDDVHFVHMNLFPGNEVDGCVSDHDPHKSLDFLEGYLKENVIDSDDPVILIHHYGFDSLSIGKREGDGVCNWWSDNQRKRYAEVIKNYNVKAIFTGHVHLRKKNGVDKWCIPWETGNGKSSKVVYTFVAGATHNGIYLDVEYQGKQLEVIRKYVNEDGVVEEVGKVKMSWTSDRSGPRDLELESGFDEKSIKKPSAPHLEIVE